MRVGCFVELNDNSKLCCCLQYERRYQTQPGSSWRTHRLWLSYTGVPGKRRRLAGWSDWLFTAILSSLTRYLSLDLIRLDALALSVIATATWLAGWLAGWLAVTLRYCIKTAKPIGKLFRPSESLIILVF